MNDAEPMVRLAGVRHGYAEPGGWHAVLDDAALTIPAGEAVALVGRSGSGKSTLLNLISGIDRPQAGTVSVGGVDITALSERERTLLRRRRIGFVFQFFNLLPTLTVAENLRLPLQLLGRGGATADRAVADLLEAVGLAGYGPRFPDTLSGGEQQRVAVARALIHEPDLILADEPTGNLDPATGNRVAELLDRLVRQFGKTLILVTHSPDLARHADRILRLQDGRLVAEAPRAA
ncbi:MAG TPA: ABC transporter ATP-binding protein [Candidatus Acidoferrales bacterium]|nr:ABC transporter ATP-binding protein [Candidatus Acidoferrales bacterium]